MCKLNRVLIIQNNYFSLLHLIFQSNRSIIIFLLLSIILFFLICKHHMNSTHLFIFYHSVPDPIEYLHFYSIAFVSHQTVGMKAEPQRSLFLQTLERRIHAQTEMCCKTLLKVFVKPTLTFNANIKEKLVLGEGKTDTHLQNFF